MRNTLSIIALSALLCISGSAYAGWHTVTGSAAVLVSVGNARDAAVNDAIRNAMLEAGAQVTTVQDFRDGVLGSGGTKVQSAVPVRKVVVVSEQNTRGRVEVVVKVLLDESRVSTCAASSIKKAVLPLTFVYADQNAYQGSAGIDNINKELSRAVFSHIAKSPSLLMRPQSNAVLRGTLGPSSPDQLLQDEIISASRQGNAQFLITGSINTAAAADAGNGVLDKLFYQRTRTLSFGVNVYDAKDGMCVFSKQYDMVADWPFKQGQYIDMRSELFAGSDFGRRMNDLAKRAAEDVTGLLQCRSVQAEIIDIEDDGFIINLGSENGIRRGMKFAIEQYSEGYDPDGRSFSQSERASGTYTVQRVDRNTAFLKSNSLDDNLLNIRLHDLAVPML